MNFKEYFEAFNDYPLGVVIPNINNFGAVSGDWSNTLKITKNDYPQGNDDMALELPTVEKTGVLNYINKKTNPILLFFICNDGSYLRLFMSLDEFNRIKGDPQIGKTATIVMQRRNDDNSNNPSKIQSITMH
jgi:hypothetical protein